MPLGITGDLCQHVDHIVGQMVQKHSRCDLDTVKRGVGNPNTPVLPALAASTFAPITRYHTARTFTPRFNGHNMRHPTGGKHYTGLPIMLARQTLKGLSTLSRRW